ncbi:isoleucine--tRNA ligase [Blattabacterium cuenoti]|uniref:isoleucine--tRNA ligase n=1 Tax=Blattabacterium cuenoti TaxID=1653831 RepID=UPI00163C3584|nr:isoleucine--tRNA ligase [Blattabacterium cuenoti]
MNIKFKEYNNLDLNKISNEILFFWEKNNFFQKRFQYKNISNHSRKSLYIVYEGPPSMNGDPGIHHFIARTIKDIFCRYYALKGKIIIINPGWDTHGLPIELSVEKQIGINKDHIGKKISINTYNNTCKSLVNKSIKKWVDFTKKIGFWLNHNNTFITYNTKYIETIWWLIKKLYKNNLIYRGMTIQPYSPAAGTGLSYHELNFPGAYKEITTLTPIFKLTSKKDSLPIPSKISNNIVGKIYFLSWTTTPWTLPSNIALAIKSDIYYLLVAINNNDKIENIIFYENLINKILPIEKYYKVINYNDINKLSIKNNKIPYCILYKFKGKDLIGSKYEQLFPWFPPFPSSKKKNAFKVVNGDNYVNTKEGTGIVHIAPTFGIDDFEIAIKHNLPSILVLNEKNIPVPLVDLKGKFLKNCPTMFSGKYIKQEFNKKFNIYLQKQEHQLLSIDKQIINLLKDNNQLFKAYQYTHNYPHCWRTNKPIIYYPLDSWFIRTNHMKNKLINLNQKIHWVPKYIGNKRFESWLNNVKDWNLSRSRYWGTPMPIWRTKDGTENIVIGSIEELYLEIEKSIKYGLMKKNVLHKFIPGNMSNENYENIDLHTPFLDQIILVSKNGLPMTRYPELIDVWFDSGAMPYAQYHYPFENKTLIDQNILFPADFIAEGTDQIRGWFFTLHTISSLLFNSIAYKTVLSTGLILDEKGKKMSKSKGNTINPFHLINEYGADAIRWYIIFSSEPWDNLKFNKKEINIVINKFFGTLHNIYSFFAIYANIDGFNYNVIDNNILLYDNEENEENNDYKELDLWIISELNSMIKMVDYYYSKYNPTKAVRIIFSFVLNKLSNWYIRICRRRFWKENYTETKVTAYKILYNSLITVAKLSSPIIPFFAERIFLDLNSITKQDNFKSVHLSKFPTYNYHLINNQLEKKMILIQRITNLVFSLRKKNNIKIRQPLQRIIIGIKDKKNKIHFTKYANIFKMEINIKDVEIVDNIYNKYSNIIKKTIEPAYNLLGPKFGNLTQKIANIIKKLNTKDIEDFEKNQQYTIYLKGQNILLSIKDVKIINKCVKYWDILSNEDVTVALDLNISNSLLEEGIIRDLIRNIQKLRKINNCIVTEKILIIIYINNKKLIFIINKYKNYICKETLSNNLLIKEYNKNNVKQIGEKIILGKELIYIIIKKI